MLFHHILQRGHNNEGGDCHVTVAMAEGVNIFMILVLGLPFGGALAPQSCTKSMFAYQDMDSSCAMAVLTIIL